MKKRGRPAVFVGNLEKRIVSLIEKNGLTGAKEKLSSYKNPIKISMQTLFRLARRNKVELKRGRRAA